jgi:hypothetical protein
LSIFSILPSGADEAGEDGVAAIAGLTALTDAELKANAITTGNTPARKFFIITPPL